MSAAASGVRLKRSISSVLVSLFKQRNTDDEIQESALVVEEQPSQENQIQDSHNDFSSEISGLFDASIADGPPLVPILPIQRLKILRYKQYLRRLEYRLEVPIDQDYLLENSTFAADHERESSIGVLGPSKKPKTGMNAAEKRLYQPKKSGKRWNGEMEYDLTEYDAVKRPKLEQDSMEPPLLATDSTAPRDRMNADDGYLSKKQMDILDGKPALGSSIPKIPHNFTTNGSISEKSASRLPALPSSGFDFLKASPTNQKLTDKADESSLSETIASKPQASKGFSFGTGALGNANTEVRSFAGAAKAKSEDKKDSSDSKNSRFGSLETNKLANQTKPSFSFGSSVSSNGGLLSKEHKSVTPSFQFGKKLEHNTESLNFDNKRPRDLEDSSAKSFGQSEKSANAPPASKIFPSSASVPKASVAAKSSFVFGSSTPETKKDASPDKSNGSSILGSGEDKSTSSFSFNANSKPSSNEAVIDSEQKVPVGSLFSFGAKKVMPNTSSLNGGEKFDETQTQTESFTFGKPNSDHKNLPNNTNPSFSFGSKPDSSKESKTNADGGKTATQAFSFEAKPKSDKASQPAFKFGGNTQPRNDENPKPAFTFGGKVGLEKPAANLSSEKNAITPAPSLFTGLTASKESSSTSSFTVGGINGANNQTKPEAGTQSFKFTLNESKSTPAFKFNNDTTKTPNGTAGIGLLNRAQAPALGAPHPVHPTTPFSFSPAATTQQQSLSGFSSASSTATPAFGASANVNQMTAPSAFVGSSTTSASPPPFGNPSPGSASGTFQQNRAFSPSHTMNLNFGGTSAAAQAPSAIFGAATNTNPAQIFGAQSSTPAATFGNDQSQGTQTMFGGGALPNQHSQQPTMMGLPPGRKLARMRARRT
ncbi:LAMI_0F09428g1_1 [Lachancea mirantina]|uniref:LAMI_0F09428g1_1 n=1 Tax=Lachancea mirantina TaxID=1230905 RepID=A0A1G4K166_9SACH|nr:LAMI_0F09428g1_1 [Lachancea mirantina]